MIVHIEDLKKMVKESEEISPVQRRILLDFIKNMKTTGISTLEEKLDEEQKHYLNKNSIDIGIYAGIELSKELIRESIS